MSLSSMTLKGHQDTLNDWKSKIKREFRKQQLIHYIQEVPKILADFSVETLQAMRVSEIYSKYWSQKPTKEEYYTQKTVLRNRKRPNKQKLRDFITTQPALQEMVKGVLHSEMEMKLAMRNSENHLNM